MNGAIYFSMANTYKRFYGAESWKVSRQTHFFTCNTTVTGWHPITGCQVMMPTSALVQSRIKFSVIMGMHTEILTVM